MRHNVGFLLLALLLPMSSAPAQTENPQAANALPNRVALARCAYAQTDGACASGKTPSQTVSARVDDNTLAQLPRRMQGPPMGRAAYPGPWISQPSPGHALIGAMVGFGFGAAAGAKNGGVRGSLAVGTLVGLLGAAIGASIPSFPSYHRYRRGWPDDDEEASRTKPRAMKPDSSRPDSGGRIAAARPDPPQSTTGPDNRQSVVGETAQNKAFSSR